VRVIDELYGLIEIPEYLTPIVTSPELQRLRDVRLLNIFSTPLAGLSDVRRLTHTLGVIGLFLRLKPLLLRTANLDTNVCKTVEVACLIHDVATPAFAHLFEWELFRTTGWNHESQCESLIKGNYGPENIYHQIYYQNQLSLHERILNLGLDPEQVWLTVTGKAQFGQLLCGSIDLDNIDNIVRMYNALGLGSRTSEALTIVDSIIPHESQLIIRNEAYSAIQSWIQARKSCYDVIVFDEQTLSSQAMLGQLIAHAIEAGVLNEEYWHLTDDLLLRKLLDFQPGKEIIKRLAIGNPFAVLGIYWYEFDKKIAEQLASYSMRQTICSQLSSDLKVPCLIYYFQDKGTFSKRLSIRMGDSYENSETQSIGEQSNSMVVGILTPSQDLRDISYSRKIITQLFESILPARPARRNIPLVKAYYGIDHQKELFN
jgi:HD superfamily phosphohydrolase